MPRLCLYFFTFVLYGHESIFCSILGVCLIEFYFMKLINNLYYLTNPNRRAVTLATKLWSDNSGLRFNEISGQADLNLKFASADHGDGAENAFDGPGGYNKSN